FFDTAFAAGTAMMSAGVFSAIGEAFKGSGGFWAENGWGHIGTHAMTGGIMNVVQGGKFGHGFISAGFTKAIRINDWVGPGDASAGADTARVLVAGIVGGTISRITGGKFANGAITAAFAQAFKGVSGVRPEWHLLRPKLL